MRGQRVILTYKDYEVLPTDGRRYELHEGELSVVPAPSPQHQRILGNLNEIIRQHVKSRALGEVFFSPIDCILAETTVVQPDLVFLDSSRLSIVSNRGLEGPPTLVLEILSPATTLIDRSTKRQLYARYGVPYYWIVDPEARTVEAYGLSEGGYQLAARAAGSETVSLPPFPTSPSFPPPSGPEAFRTVSVAQD
jgi:Uma2 family endonuclease